MSTTVLHACACLLESALHACEFLCVLHALVSVSACKYAYSFVALVCACPFVRAYIRVCMSHSSCRYFISLLRLGGAAQLGVHYDSYNLTNWDGGGFGLNLS